jgi:hypothetical protein
LAHPGRPSIITSVLLRGRQEAQSQGKKCDYRSRGWRDTEIESCYTDGLENEGGAMSQGMQVASESWKRQEDRFFLRSL